MIQQPVHDHKDSSHIEPPLHCLPVAGPRFRREGLFEIATSIRIIRVASRPK